MYIYKLEYEGLILYVGKTKNMKNRYYQHCDKKNESCGSRDIPEDMHWTMILLEECEDILATSREQHFFDTLKPLYNKNRPGQTQKEYNRAHLEVHREASRKYDAAHREQRRETYRRHHAANREARNAKKREAMRKYHEANKDAINAKRKERRRIARASSQGDAALTTHLPVEAASSTPL